MKVHSLHTDGDDITVFAEVFDAMGGRRETVACDGIQWHLDAKGERWGCGPTGPKHCLDILAFVAEVPIALRKWAREHVAELGRVLEPLAVHEVPAMRRHGMGRTQHDWVDVADALRLSRKARRCKGCGKSEARREALDIGGGVTIPMADIWTHEFFAQDGFCSGVCWMVRHRRLDAVKQGRRKQWNEAQQKMREAKKWLAEQGIGQDYSKRRVSRAASRSPTTASEPGHSSPQ